jgi:hypothetical protein
MSTEGPHLHPKPGLLTESGVLRHICRHGEQARPRAPTAFDREPDFEPK